MPMDETPGQEDKAGGVAAPGDEQYWSEDDTVAFRAVPAETPGHKDDTAAFWAVPAETPGHQDDTVAFRAVPAETPGHEDDTVAFRAVPAETPGNEAGAEVVAVPRVEGCWTAEADAEIIPAVTEETPRQRRRRWGRQSEAKSSLTPTADIIEQYSKLTGEITQAPEGPYRVQYRRVTSRGEWFQLMALLLATLAASAAFFIWLIAPSHYPNTQYMPIWIVIGSHTMYWTILAVEGLRLLNSLTVCWSAGVMRDPVPVEAPSTYKLAFATAFVPSSEPISVLRETLMAAKRMRYAGPEVEVWVLDEGDDAQVKRLCTNLGVRHFSRHGVPEWNTERGRQTARERFGARTKHGNYNAWHEYLRANNIHYDLVVSCDMDHAPLPCFLERLLGYFRDPNVAYVVTPQVYANAVYNWIARAAEAMNHMFHSVVQPAGNYNRCAMFVGTNNIYRVSAWQGIGNFQPSITEDLATAYGVLGSKNPETGKHWEAVYARDVLAHGAGPDHWAAMFKQQGRWARGSNEIMVVDAWKCLWRLPWGRRLHYLQLMLHYPTVALTWLLGVALTILYMTLGTTGIAVHINQWAAFYLDVFTMRLVLYLCLRRFNISPHESPGSFGMSGIFMSILCTPFYSTAFVSTFLRRTLRFDVTPKGTAGESDRAWQSFRKHWFWSAVSAAVVGGAIMLHHTYRANMVWAVLGLVTSMLPFMIWSTGRAKKKLRLGSPERNETNRPSPAALTVTEAGHGIYDGA